MKLFGKTLKGDDMVSGAIRSASATMVWEEDNGRP